ncbi:MAG TPA: NTP transferase domain-containing protein [Chthoniobacterales bacterium]|nr:NTP transferase domain-containing protein [Chthoniobacterales bacterium]
MKISDAVILMAGAGSRLRGSAETIAKPLIPIGGRPLISYAIDSFDQAGVERIHAVVGPNGDELAAAVAPLLPAHMQFHPIPNSKWQKQNGVSLLMADGKVQSPFFLAMGDHLFQPSILNSLLASADPARLNLAIDRKIADIFDLDDAMKVRIDGKRLVAIGKKLDNYNAIDTGIFICPESIFESLQRVMKNDDCALADGVRLMAEEGNALAIDIGDAWWQDVDTPEMLAQAEEELRARASSKEGRFPNRPLSQGGL